MSKQSTLSGFLGLAKPPSTPEKLSKSPTKASASSNSSSSADKLSSPPKNPVVAKKTSQTEKSPKTTSSASVPKQVSEKVKTTNTKKRKRLLDEDDDDFTPGNEREEDHLMDEDAVAEDDGPSLEDGMEIDDTDDEDAASRKKAPKKSNGKSLLGSASAASSSAKSSTNTVVSKPLPSGTIREKLEAAMTMQDEERHAQWRERIVQSVERMRDRMAQYQAEDGGNEEEGEDGEEEEEEVAKPKKTAAKKGGSKYTPLELQYLEIRKEYPDSVLFVESGYRYRFFGEDAKIAAKVLNIRAGVTGNFLSTSVPVHRLHVHAMRLVQAGYKVGVVSQTETAALKAISSNKSGPFKRAVSALYTKSTLVNESMDPLASDSASYGQYLMAIYESPIHSPKLVDGLQIDIVAVKTSTGDIIYDSFEDGVMRTELETRLRHISPIELILSEQSSSHTKKMVDQYATSCKAKEDIPRIEYLKPNAFDLKLAQELIADELVNFAAQLETQKSGELGKNLKDKADTFFKTIQNPLKICFGALAFYLKDFGISSLICLSCNFNSFSNKRHMVLDGNALNNLELLTNQQTFTKEGSLMSIIDRTSTSFGRRRLMQWIRQPLMISAEIQGRLDAVEELSSLGTVSSESVPTAASQSKGIFSANPNRNGLAHLLALLPSLPDLERGICRIFSNRCSVNEFISVLSGFRHIEKCMPKTDEIDACVKSPLLKEILKSIPHDLAEHVSYFLDPLNMESTDKQKRDLFLDDSSFPALHEIKNSLKETEDELNEHLEEIRDILGKPRLDYVTKNKDEYVIEVTKAEGAKAPKNWITLAGPKTQSRFHTPFIVEKYQELLQYRERMAIETANVWASFVKEFSTRYSIFRNTVDSLAVLDCLNSLATLAKTDGYVKPIILDPSSMDVQNQDSIDDYAEITIKNGRHPIVESLLASSSQPFVPNDTTLGVKAHSEKCIIITGPNMGGKTCYTRQVAILCVMAQMGCFVPADEMKLTPLDLIATRMGAYDNAMKGQSTFFVELQETSDILKTATSRSLVILDELGRGTSTHDGYAIAFATLQFLLTSTKCFTLFVTHYPGLSQLTRLYPNLVQNHHISYLEDSANPSAMEVDEGYTAPKITLLHKLVKGTEGRSFGMNVARLANLPSGIVAMASAKSNSLENQVKQRYARAGLAKLYQFSNQAVAQDSLKQATLELQASLSSKR